MSEESNWEALSGKNRILFMYWLITKVSERKISEGLEKVEAYNTPIFFFLAYPGESVCNQFLL